MNKKQIKQLKDLGVKQKAKADINDVVLFICIVTNPIFYIYAPIKFIFKL
jgi:hypothetical protein